MAVKSPFFDKIPHPTTLNEHEEIQNYLTERENSEHQNVEIEKSIEVMDKYSDDYEFILSALQERCQDYRETLNSLEDSLRALADAQPQYEDSAKFYAEIESVQTTIDDYERVCESLQLQQRAIDTIERQPDPVDKKLQELEMFKETLSNLEDEENSPNVAIMQFIKDLNDLQEEKVEEEDDGFEPVSLDQYKSEHFNVKLILNQHYEGKLFDSDASDNENGSSKSPEASPKSNKEDKTLEPDSEYHQISTDGPLLHAKHENGHLSSQDDFLDLTVEDKLRNEIEEQDQEIAKIQAQIDYIKNLKESGVSKEDLLQQKSADFEPTLFELLEKNNIGCTKIETLFGKVRKSREKIDQVLNDILLYHKEFETIQINKKCRPAKLKLSRRVLATRLECYKNYLLHLQTVIDALEREIRGFKQREKEFVKKAKIAGVGVQQKHNTYADQLKKKIAMLEKQIQADLKGPQATKGKRKKSQKPKSKVFGVKRQSKSSVRTQNVAKDLKSAKADLKDREDQVRLLEDMLRSSAQENKMKDKEVERLQRKVRTFTGKQDSMFKSVNKLPGYDKHNKTENTFLPTSLRGAVKAEAGFPISGKSKGSLSKGSFPTVKGAHPYDDRSSNNYDEYSQRSHSQVSLAISQKRGEKVVKESRKRQEQLKETPRMYKETRVTSIEPVDGDDNMIDLRIQEEDPGLEEGTMRLISGHEKPILPPDVDDDSNFEEGHPDDYNLNEF